MGMSSFIPITAAGTPFQQGQGGATPASSAAELRSLLQQGGAHGNGSATGIHGSIQEDEHDDGADASGGFQTISLEVCVHIMLLERMTWCRPPMAVACVGGAFATHRFCSSSTACLVSRENCSPGMDKWPFTLCRNDDQLYCRSILCFKAVEVLFVLQDTPSAQELMQTVTGLRADNKRLQQRLAAVEEVSCSTALHCHIRIFLVTQCCTYQRASTRYYPRSTQECTNVNVQMYKCPAQDKSIDSKHNS